MKIVIIDQLGTCAALLAASYLTGKIGGQPSKEELLRLPAFARQKNLQPGELREIGRDAAGRTVYTLGVGSEGVIMRISAGDLWQLLKVRADVRIIDVSAYNGVIQRICWYVGMLPLLQGLSREMSAYLQHKNLPRLFAFLGAELAEAGLENSLHLDLESKDNG